MNPRLLGKISLVTGGASGLGAAISRRLAQDGARLIITDIQTEAGAHLADELHAEFLEHDVTLEAHWTDILQQVERRHGALHILVNNAGIAGPMDRISPEDTALSDWRTLQQVNVESILIGCRTAIPLLRRSGGGSIINMSSIAGLLPMPEGMAYGASKAAVAHMTKSIALYCARNRYRIRCNSVYPGNVLTPLLERAIEGLAQRRGLSSEQIVQEMKHESPLGEFMEPEDIASAVAFLASDEARYITGTQLVVDGGSTLGSA